MSAIKATDPRDQHLYDEYVQRGGTLKKIPFGQCTDPDVLSKMLRPKRGRKKKVKPFIRGEVKLS
mgnify:FL=1